MSGRTVIAAALAAVALLAVGCGMSAPIGGGLVLTPPASEPTAVASWASGPSAGNQSHHLSAAHRALALAAAHQEANHIAVGLNDTHISGWPSGISAVRAGAHPGTITDSNTGHECTSAEIISVRLVGRFDTVTTGTTAGPGHDDFTVREIDLSVDAATGSTCLIGVRTQPVPPGPGDTVLYNR